MINLDFSLAIGIFLICSLILILALWIFSRMQKGKSLILEKKHIWHCSVCTYSYINTKEEKISVCPRCGSYNKKSS